MYILTSTLLLLPVLVTANPLDADFTPLNRRQSPPADQIIINDTSTSGNGCPQGSVSTSLSPDSTVVTFGFDSFQAYIGPTAAQADKSKACQIHLSLQYPGGFQYAVVDATYHGYARLDAGVTGNFLSTYYFSQDAANTCTTKSSITGPEWLDGDVYTKEDQVETTATIWAPCGDTGLLNVNNRIALTATNSTLTGELSDDDATVAFTHQVHVSWRPCTPTSGSGSSGFGVGPSGSTVTERDEPAASSDPGSSWTIGPGGTTVTTPGEDGAAPGGGTWSIGPGNTTIITSGEE